MLTVRLAGGLALERDGVAAELPRSRRGRALLAWLALHPGMHARGTLAARFWPDVLDASARTSLRAALTELRAALGEDAVCLRATREAVGLDGAHVDVRAFVALLESGDVAGAVGVCRGELLAGMDDDWVHDVRGAHNARAQQAFATLAAGAAATGDAGGAVAWARQAAALDPLDEAGQRSLMERLAAAGDRVGALRVGEQLADRLRSELGIALSPPTRTLMAALREPGEAEVPGPATAPTARVPLPAAIARADERPFAGRIAELERLWALAARPGRRMVVIGGDPGLGKTRLALRFASDAYAAGATVLLGRCTEEPLAAYASMTEALAPCGASPFAGEDRAQMFAAVEAMLSALPEPVVLVVDDLQWADRGTLLLLGALLRSGRPGRLLIVATARGAGEPNQLTATLVSLRRDGEVERIALPPLDRDAVAELAEPGMSSEDVAAIHLRSGGNAFYVQELLYSGGAVTDTVRDALAARRAGLTSDADGLLAAAAVLGERTPISPLLITAQLDEDPGERALAELQEAHLLRTTPTGVEFAHALVREAVLADLNAVRRARLHRAAAAALTPDEVEQRAHHLIQAGDARAAVPDLERAADRAMGMAAYEQAARFWADAVTALDTAHVADDARKGALLAAAGEALLRAADAAGARVRFSQATAIARRTRDSALLARAALGACGLTVEIRDVDGERVGLLEEALHAVPADAHATRSALLARLAVELYYAPGRDRSERLSADAVVAARRSGDPAALATALNARHVALWRADRVTQRLDIAREMQAAALAAGDRALQLQAINWHITDLFEAGELAAWREEIVRHQRLAEDLHLPAYTWYATLWQAVDAQNRGDVETAERLRLQARDAGQRANDSNGWLFTEMMVFTDWVISGETTQVDYEWVEDRIATSATGIAYRSGYAWCLALDGRSEEARAQLDFLVTDNFAAVPFDTNWISALAEAMETAHLIGHRPTAEAIRVVLAPYAGRNVTAGRAVTSYGCTDRQLGHAAALLGDLEGARRHYTEAISLDGARGLTIWADRARRAREALER